MVRSGGERTGVTGGGCGDEKNVTVTREDGVEVAGVGGVTGVRS